MERVKKEIQQNIFFYSFSAYETNLISYTIYLRQWAGNGDQEGQGENERRYEIIDNLNYEHPWIYFTSQNRMNKNYCHKFHC